MSEKRKPEPIAVFECFVSGVKTSADHAPVVVLELQEEGMEEAAKLLIAERDRKYLRVIVLESKNDESAS